MRQGTLSSTSDCRTRQRAREHGAQPAPWRRPQRHEGVQVAGSERLEQRAYVGRPAAVRGGLLQVEHPVADRDADAPGLGAARTPQAPERQVLDREVGRRRIRRLDPAAQAGVVGLVDEAHSAKRSPSPAQHCAYAASSAPHSSANAVGRKRQRLSNMNASVASSLCGASAALLARSNASASGPCGTMQSCRLIPPGTKPSGLASYCPQTSPMNSLITLRWYQGGRKVPSATIQRGGKITKSQFAVPGVSLGLVSTVKMLGSGWSKLIEPMAMKLAVSYFSGARLPCQATTSNGVRGCSVRHRRPPNLRTIS